MGTAGGPYIVRDSSLVLELDAADQNSFKYVPTPTSSVSSLVRYRFLNNESWPGTGSSVTNIGSGGSTYNGTITGSYTRTYLSGMGSALECSAGWIKIPGTATLYSGNFTWIVYHIPKSNDTNIHGILWSESGAQKNFLWTYANIGNYTSPTNPTYARFDTYITTYQSPSVGTETNGFGGVGGYFQAYNRPIASILVKNGTTITEYYVEAPGSGSSVATPTLLWTVTVSDYGIVNNSIEMSIGARNDGGFYMPQTLIGCDIFTSALSTTEIKSAIENFGFTYGYTDNEKWYDLTKTNYSASFTNGIKVIDSNQGSFQFLTGSLQSVTGSDLGSLSNFTINCWFNLDILPTTAGAACIVTNAYPPGGTALNYSIGLNNSPSSANICFGFFLSSTWRTTTGFTPEANTWYNVAGTYDGSTLIQYVNGEFNTSLNFAGTPITSGNGFRIGRRWDAGNPVDYINGQIPIVQIYNRALSAIEVAQNYNQQKSRFGL